MNHHFARCALFTLVAASLSIQQANAADCVIAKLDGAKIAGFYQSGGQTLGQLYQLSQTAKDEDMAYSLQAQGPLASFSDASYMIADLLKLRMTVVTDKDRAIIDADIKANLELAGPAFYSAADFLGAIGAKAQNGQIRNVIMAGQKLVNDGIASYGGCMPAPAKH
jgi:hypothetical protein